MTAIVALLKALALPALAAGIMAGLLAAWYALSSEQFILFLFCCLAGLLAVFVAIIVSAGFPFRRDSDAAVDATADEHMGPLRQPGDAEKTLALDLRQRRMLLPGQRGQRGKHAARPAPAPELPAVPPSADVPTESILVVQDVTEVLPVVPAPVPVLLAAPAKPGRVFEGWDTGQFERDIMRLGLAAGEPGDGA